MARRSYVWAAVLVVAWLVAGPLRAQEIDNGTIRAVFHEDPSAGLVLDALGRSGETFAFTTLPPDAAGAGLWQLVLTPRDGSPQVILSPADAGASSVTWDADALGVSCTWTDVSAPGLGDTFDVTLHARAESGDPWLRWTAVVGRTAGTSASLDVVRFPVTHWAAPITPQGGETLLEAQRRARVLIPSNGKAFIAASPLDVMDSLGFEYDLVHPAPGTVMGQFMGWSALADMDPSDEGFRHVLTLGALDFSGHYKVFHHRWTTPSDVQPAASWWHDAYPAFDGTDPDGWDNSYASPYPVITGVTVARTNAFWYAVVAPYREAFASSTQAVTPMTGNPALGAARRPFWLTGHIQLGTGQSGEPLYRGFQRQADRIRAVLEPAGVAQALPISHWQTYLAGGEGVRTPDTPVDTTIDSGVPAVVGDMEADGYTVSVYVYGSGVYKPSAWYSDVFSQDVPDAEALHRDGTVFADDEMAFDLGHPSIAQYFTDHVVHDVSTWVGSSGIYLDVLVGSGAALAYHRPYHAGHGGDYWMEGKRRFAAAARQEMAQRAQDNGKTIEDSLVISEGAEEGVVGRLDLTQDGYGWIPGLMRFYESALLGSVPDASLSWSPPLWSAVYHEWMPVTQLAMPFTNAALATSPYQEGFTGLSTEQMVDLWTFVYALYAAAGYRLEFDDYAEYEGSPLVEVGAGGGLTVDPAVDPDGAGLEIATFLRRLWAAYDHRGCGPFLLWGRMAQPLGEDFTDPEVSTVTNPISALAGTNPSHIYAVYPAAVLPSTDPGTGDLVQDLGATPMPVPAVLTSVWQYRGDTAVVAINWTGAPRSHRATLDPGAYLPPGSSYYLETPQLRWIGPLATDAGSLDLHWTAGVTSPPQVHLENLPERTIQVLRLRLALPGDDDGDRDVDADDVAGIVAEIFDLDGRNPLATPGSSHLGSANDDLDGDLTVAAPDLAAIVPIAAH